MATKAEEVRGQEAEALSPSRKRPNPSAQLITSSPNPHSAKKLKNKKDEGQASARSLDSELESETLSSSISARARTFFSPVFSPVLNLFKPAEKGKDDKDTGASPDKGSEGSVETKDSLTASSLAETEETDNDSETPDCCANADVTWEWEDSNSDLDEDYEDFDPFEFIKNLPPAENNTLPPAPLPKRKRSDQRVSLVLDLDETLVHASLEHMENAHLTFNVNVNNQDYTVWVKIRPGCIEFLERLAEKFELIVFTASQKIYADKVLNLIDPEKRYIKHRVFRDSCVLVHDNYIKDLNVLSRDLSKVAIVDNSPQAFGYQLSNGIPIRSWFGDTQDRCLLNLLPFIEHLASTDDVRPHIKNKFKLHKRVEAAGEPEPEQ